MIKILMIAMLVVQSTYGMLPVSIVLHTNRAILDQIKEAVVSSCGNNADKLSTLQAIYHNLDCRQKALEYVVRDNKLSDVIWAQCNYGFMERSGKAMSDVFLWQTLFEVVDEFHSQIQQDTKEVDVSSDRKILRDKCKLLFARISMGLNLELMRCTKCLDECPGDVKADSF